MRPKRLALLALVVVLLIVVVYVYAAKPTLVLPGVTVALPSTIPLNGYMQQKNISGLDVKVRTDGKIFATAGGQELAQVEFTPRSLANSVNLAQKMLLPDSYRTTIRLVPIIFPGLASSVMNVGLTVYFVLPIEMNVQFTRG